MKNVMKNTLRNSLRLFAALSVLSVSFAANAADVVYPPGVRVGVVPSDGLTVAKEFLGFETDDKNVKFGMAELPPEAFTTVETAFKEGKAIANGAKVEPFKTSAGDAFITVESRKEGEATFKTYSLIAKGETFTGYVIAQIRDGAPKALAEADVRKVLATTTMRSEIPVDEQLSLLPFKVGELSGFKTVKMLAMRQSVLLTDGTEETTLDGAPYMIIGTIQAAPATQDDRGRFSEQVARAIPGLKNARVTTNEPMRIDGTQGYETRIEAVTGKNDTPVNIVQWIRFGGSGSSMRIIASATKDDWTKAFPRFRAVRDGIGPK